MINTDVGIKELGKIKKFWKNSFRGSFNLELYKKYLEAKK